MDPETEAVGPLTPSVQRLAGARLLHLERYATALRDEGVLRGLIGPREIPRLWERHILNSAAVAPFLPETGSVADLGSGAGLPGVVLACLRPELQFVLVEPMLRRTTWLEEVVEHVGLENVEVRRARAEDLVGELTVDAVTARAVAPLERLAGWALPLCHVGGVLLALKGGRAQEELDAARPHLGPLGGDGGEVLTAGTVPEVEATSVVMVRKVRATEMTGRSGATEPTRRPTGRRRRRGSR
ncbi:MAG: 16S rRNA (guanine(527)-N(7))-methyltransferase RsmG [Actinotalea sp.]|nr:16S rRNA (guanine(527)-N(7))-methyltransferase RsmG [Actinotalea sp.]